MHPLVKNTIKFFLFLAVSAFLFWLVYRDQNWDELLTVLKEDVNYFWIGVACVMGIASHVSRALRWQLLTASMGYRISFGNSFMGVMIGYFANLAIPRMGEFTRCGVVSKYEEVPFSKLLGTVVTERVIDMMILLFLTLIVVITQFKQVGIFLDNNQEIEEKVVNMFHSSWMLLVLVVLAAVGWLFWRLIRKTRFKERIHSFFKGLKEGLLSVKDVRHKGLFVFYSLFIWLMYFLMFYVCFFCFQFTSHLGAGRVDYFRSFELWYGGSCTGRYRGLAFYGYSSFDDLFAAYPEYRKHGQNFCSIDPRYNDVVIYRGRCDLCNLAAAL